MGFVNRNPIKKAIQPDYIYRVGTFKKGIDFGNKEQAENYVSNHGGKIRKVKL